MIQRIQSLLLLTAGALSLSLFGLPFATSAERVQSSSILNDGVYNLHDNIGILLAFLVGGALSLAAIFMFKNRTNQTLLARFAFIANLVGVILVVVFYLNDTQNQGAAVVSDGAGAYLPLASMILLLVAMRYIKKDDTLVRSMDRLR